MPLNCRGFSLIEALVAVLMISFGFLGLGQLQARLTQGTGDLHTLGSARLFGLNAYELRKTDWIAYNTISGNRLRPGYGENLSINTVLQTSSRTRSAQISVSWQRPSGTKSIGLFSIEDPQIQFADTRWLTHQP